MMLGECLALTEGTCNYRHTCGPSELLSKAPHKTVNSYFLSENTFINRRHNLIDSDGILLGSDQFGAFPFPRSSIGFNKVVPSITKYSKELIGFGCVNHFS